MNQNYHIEQILDETQSLNKADILSAINVIAEVDRKKRENFNSIDNWIPRPETISNLVRLIIYPLDLDYTLETFADRVREKQFSLDSTLDSKFIVHAKYLVSSGKIKGRQETS